MIKAKKQLQNGIEKEKNGKEALMQYLLVELEIKIVELLEIKI